MLEDGNSFFGSCLVNRRCEFSSFKINITKPVISLGILHMTSEILNADI
jgi:hypothetical protein